MLCPEIWEFQPPRYYSAIDSLPTKSTSIPPTINDHYYNHSVSVVFPSSSDIPTTLLDSIFEDTDYYKVEDLSVSQLLDKKFIEAFVKNGELSLLSINNKIDVDNVICITPKGNLILSILLEDYQSLGIEGKPSYFDRKKKSRYIIELDLKEDIFTQEKNKKSNRIRDCLKNNLKQTFKVVVAWDPPENKLCPSSVAAWFHSQGNKVSVCHPKLTERIERSLDIPTLEVNCDIEAFLEWIGIFSLGGSTINENSEKYVNSYMCPKPNIPTSQVLFLECTGFFTRSKIIRIFNSMKKIMKEENSSVPWASIHINGFADSPVSWYTKEHGYFTNGNNNFTLLFKPNGEHIVHKILSSNNKPRISQ